MSEYKHFLEIDGSVYSTDDAEGRRLARDLPEVKVVPLDAIVIDRADLPTQDSILYSMFPGSDKSPRIKSGGAQLVVRGASPEYAEDQARHYLALAQWLREHPPVDEEQVQALAELLDEWIPDDHRARARHLVQRGVRVEKKP